MTETVTLILLAVLAIAVLLQWRAHRALQRRVLLLEYRERNRVELHAGVPPVPSRAGPPGLRDHHPAPRTHTVVG